MKTTYWRICVLTGLLPWSLACHGAAIDPSDPSIVVPVIHHETAFKTYMSAGNEAGAPDKRWRAANEAVSATATHDHAMPMRDAMEKPAPVPSEANEPQPKQNATGPSTPPSHDHHEKGH